ncbi:hypothetical protein JCM3765_001645 [Sporobolomyces pararoseus]
MAPPFPPPTSPRRQSHLPRFPIGASPADIAPPISLRRKPPPPSQSQSQNKGNVNTQGGTEVGTSSSSSRPRINLTSVGEYKKSKDASKAFENSREKEIQKKKKEKEKNENRVEIIILDHHDDDGEGGSSKGKGKGKERQEVSSTEPKKDLVDKGKGKQQTTTTTNCSPAKSSVPKMPIAQIPLPQSSSKQVGPTPLMKKKKQKEKQKTGQSFENKDRSSNHETARERFNNHPAGTGGRVRGRGRDGHWRGGIQRPVGRGRPALNNERSFSRHAQNPLLSLGHLTSWVLVNDKAVELFKVKPKGPMAMSCYICTPATSSSSRPVEFAVGFRDDRPFSPSAPDLLVECVVDGVVVKHEEVVIRALKDGKDVKNPKIIRSRTWTWRGRRESATVIRPFVFSPLKLTEDEDLACSSESIIRQLGTIQLRIFRGKVVGTATSSQVAAGEEEGYKAGIEMVEEMVFEESSAKVKGAGVSHHAGLGPRRFENQIQRSGFEMSEEDSSEKPYVSLEFVYRSRDVLELKGIIPPREPPTPPSAPQSSSSSASSNRVPSMSAVPKNRTESPALILAGRPPTRRLSTTPPLRQRVPAKKEEPEDEEDAETRRRILQRKLSRKAIDERNLGTLVLSSSGEESDSDQEKREPKTKIKPNLLSSPPQIKSVSVLKSTKVVKASSSPLTTRTIHAAARGGGNDQGASSEQDLEIARLREEIASLKKAQELAELRRERNELARLAGLTHENESGTRRDNKKPSGVSGSERRISKGGKRKSPEVEEEEAEEVAGLLVAGPRLQESGHKAFEERLGQTKWWMMEFQPFVRFCQSVDVPVFPVTPHLLALSIVSQKYPKATPSNYVNLLRGTMKETEEVLPLGTLPTGIIAEEEAWNAFEEFRTERTAMRVSKQLETALVRADEERSAFGLRSFGGRSVPPVSTSRREDAREQSTEILVRTPKAFSSPPKSNRKKRARNVSPSPSLSPITASDKKPHLQSAKNPSKLVSRSTQTCDLLGFNPRPATPPLEPRNIPSTTTNTPQTASTSSAHTSASQASTPCPSKAGKFVAQTQVSTVSPQTLPTQNLSLLATFERDESTLDVSQLTSLLKGLDASLSVLASPLYEAGFDSIDLLANLASFSSSRIDRICRNLERAGGNEVTTAVLDLFKQKLEEAKNAGRV